MLTRVFMNPLVKRYFQGETINTLVNLVYKEICEKPLANRYLQGITINTLVNIVYKGLLADLLVAWCRLSRSRVALHPL